MIKEMLLAGALLANNSINIRDFYSDRVALCNVYFSRDQLVNNPIYIYDPFTNRIAYETGYYYNQTSYTHIEQELDYWGVYETNPITLLDEGFYPYANSYTYDYYYFDVNINIKSITPAPDASFPDPEEDLYIAFATFDQRGVLQDEATIHISPIKSGGYNEYSFNIGDYFDFINYKPITSESTYFDWENQYRYIGLALIDYNEEFTFNMTLDVSFTMTEWQYFYSEDDINYSGINLMENYLNKELITNSNEFKTLNSQYYELSNDYINLDASYTNLERLYQELQQENEELRANAITGNTFGSVIKIISDNAAALLETEILPNFTIGNIIFIPVIFSLIGIIFKFFRR